MALNFCNYCSLTKKDYIKPKCPQVKLNPPLYLSIYRKAKISRLNQIFKFLKTSKSNCWQERKFF